MILNCSILRCYKRLDYKFRPVSRLCSQVSRLRSLRDMCKEDPLTKDVWRGCTYPIRDEIIPEYPDIVYLTIPSTKRIILKHYNPWFPYTDEGTWWLMTMWLKEQGENEKKKQEGEVSNPEVHDKQNEELEDAENGQIKDDQSSLSIDWDYVLPKDPREWDNTVNGDENLTLENYWIETYRDTWESLYLDGLITPDDDLTDYDIDVLINALGGQKYDTDGGNMLAISTPEDTYTFPNAMGNVAVQQLTWGITGTSTRREFKRDELLRIIPLSILQEVERAGDDNIDTIISVMYAGSGTSTLEQYVFYYDKKYKRYIVEDLNWHIEHP